MTKPGDSPQAAVVEVHFTALRTRDLEALRATVSTALVEQLDDPGFAARLEILGSLVPDDPVVTSLSEEGDRSSLDLETDFQSGRVELVLEPGGWKVAGQSWRARAPHRPS